MTSFDELAPKLHDLIDGRLDASEEREIRAVLERNPEFARRFRELEMVITGLSDLRQERAPEGFADRVRTRIDADAGGVRPAGVSARGPLRLLRYSGLAAAVLLAVFAGTRLMSPKDSHGVLDEYDSATTSPADRPTESETGRAEVAANSPTPSLSPATGAESQEDALEKLKDAGVRARADGDPAALRKAEPPGTALEEDEDDPAVRDAVPTREEEERELMEQPKPESTLESGLVNLEGEPAEQGVHSFDEGLFGLMAKQLNQSTWSVSTDEEEGGDSDDRAGKKWSKGEYRRRQEEAKSKDAERSVAADEAVTGATTSGLASEALGLRVLGVGPQWVADKKNKKAQAGRLGSAVLDLLAEDSSNRSSTAVQEAFLARLPPEAAETARELLATESDRVMIVELDDAAIARLVEAAASDGREVYELTLPSPPSRPPAVFAAAEASKRADDGEVGRWFRLGEKAPSSDPLLSGAFKELDRQTAGDADRALDDAAQDSVRRYLVMVVRDP